MSGKIHVEENKILVDIYRNFGNHLPTEYIRLQQTNVISKKNPV